MPDVAPTRLGNRIAPELALRPPNADPAPSERASLTDACRQARELASRLGNERVSTLLEDAYRACLGANPDPVWSESAATRAASAAGASLVVHLLGSLEIRIGDEPVAHWPRGRGPGVLKYLLLHRHRPVCKDVLTSVFWPDASPASARNNLNVAIHGARKALARAAGPFELIVLRDGRYQLNPQLPIWVDAESFMAHVERARRAEARGDTELAAHEYRGAELLYQGDLLEDDRYADWLAPIRSEYRSACIRALDVLADYHLARGEYAACIAMSNRVIRIEACNEASHARLMRCYCRMGQQHLAIRQYRLLVDTLARELELAPGRATVLLFEDVRRGRLV
jgi:DNA-binding SARP family transcriptional activator